MPVLAAHDLSETKLYQRLASLESGGALAAQVRALCDEAAVRLKQFPAQHPQFTLHDEVHCLRVVTLMGALLGPVVDALNEVELALLILSAYFHDQGMIVDAAELPALRESEGWKEHVAHWAVEHPNRSAVLQRLAEPLLTPEQRQQAIHAAADLDAAMFTDFVRQRHGDRSAEFVMTRYGNDARLVAGSRSLAGLLAALCRSHVLPASALTAAAGLRVDELVGTVRVNVTLLAFVLRLADILDFDRDRTPDPLYRAITFSSGVSLLEWEKHRSVVGWEITPDRIAFAAECAHPAYERAIRQFVTWIDEELGAAREWSRSLPFSLQAHRLSLPASVDISHVGARLDPVTGRPEYLYHDLEFTLARDELVKLLMTSNLYNGRGLFVRELMQNALDALRHRQALWRMSGVEPPELKVEFEHAQDDAGFDVVRCIDNGVGMDVGVVRAFLTRAGRSFYRSPEFERERARFQLAGCDFDPCARFGIGFMSCFMFGDEITIRTRRDYGVGRAHGDPLVVHVTGLSGIIEIRPGAADQPVGTTVEVRARRKSFIADEWDDPVWLLAVVNGYAIATEFPVSARCTVPGIAGAVDVPTTFEAHPHPLELLALAGKRLFRVDLSVADPRLRGEMRVCTLVDEQGVVTTANDEARVRVQRTGTGPAASAHHIVEFRDGQHADLHDRSERSQVCADGILVAGWPGRTPESGRRLGSYNSQLHFEGATYVIDTRGSLKPTLTPARTPPDRGFRREPTWRHLEHVAGAAYGRLLEDVLNACSPETDPARFWAVAAAYSLDVASLPLDTFAERVHLPVRLPDGATAWRRLWELGPVRLVFPDRTHPGADADTALEARGASSPWELRLGSDAVLAMPPEITELYTHSYAASNELWLLKQLLVACSVAQVTAPLEMRLSPASPGRNSLRDQIVGDRSTPSRLYLLRFNEAHRQLLRVAGTSAFLNASNPVVAHMRDALEAKSDDRLPLEQFFATLLWSWPLLQSTEPAPAGSWSARTRVKLGHLHAAIDWKAVDERLCPPFHAFVPGVGIDTLTVAQFELWHRGG